MKHFVLGVWLYLDAAVMLPWSRNAAVMLPWCCRLSPLKCTKYASGQWHHVMRIAGAEGCKEVCVRARRNVSAFNACPNRPADKQSHAKWHLVAMDPDKRQKHVEQLSNCAVRRDGKRLQRYESQKQLCWGPFQTSTKTYNDWRRHGKTQICMSTMERLEHRNGNY